MQDDLLFKVAALEGRLDAYSILVVGMTGAMLDMRPQAQSGCEAVLAQAVKTYRVAVEQETDALQKVRLRSASKAVVQMIEALRKPRRFKPIVIDGGKEG